MMNSTTNFQVDSLLKGFLEDWRVGSITPTSQKCVRDICSNIDWTKVKNIFELGAGDGVFSRYLLQEIDSTAKITCVESNKLLAKHLRQSLKDARIKIIERDALPLIKSMTHHNNSKTDCIICGIPLSFMKKKALLQFIKNCKNCLSPDGVLILYQSIFTLYNLKDILKVTGVKYSSSNLRIHWGNFPPLWSVQLENNKIEKFSKTESLAA